MPRRINYMHGAWRSMQLLLTRGRIDAPLAGYVELTPLLPDMAHPGFPITVSQGSGRPGVHAAPCKLERSKWQSRNKTVHGRRRSVAACSPVLTGTFLDLCTRPRTAGRGSQVATANIPGIEFPDATRGEIMSEWKHDLSFSNRNTSRQCLHTETSRSSTGTSTDWTLFFHDATNTDRSYKGRYF